MTGCYGWRGGVTGCDCVTGDGDGVLQALTCLLSGEDHLIRFSKYLHGHLFK